MTDAAFDNASHMRDALAKQINQRQAELDDIRRQLAAVDAWLEAYAAFSNNLFPGSDQNILPSLQKAEEASVYGSPVAKHTRANSRKEEVAQAARSFIEMMGQPVPRPRLLDELRQRGFVIEGGEPEGVLNTMLWRTRDDVGVIHLRNTGYWLKEREWQPSHYSPQYDLVMGVEDSPPEEDVVYSRVTDEILARLSPSEIEHLRASMVFMGQMPEGYFAELTSLATRSLGRELNSDDGGLLVKNFTEGVERRVRSLKLMGVLS